MNHDYKIVASKLERLKLEDYIKARIYLEIQDIEDISDELIDTYVEEGYKYWWNDDYIQPEEIGRALYIGYLHSDEKDFDSVLELGLTS